MTESFFSEENCLVGFLTEFAFLSQQNDSSSSSDPVKISQGFCDVQVAAVWGNHYVILRNLCFSLTVVAFPLLLFQFRLKYLSAKVKAGNKYFYRDAGFLLFLRIFLAHLLMFFVIWDPYGANNSFPKWYNFFLSTFAGNVLSTATSVAFIWYSTLSSLYSWDVFHIRFVRISLELQMICMIIFGVIPSRSALIRMIQFQVFLFQIAVLSIVNFLFGFPIVVGTYRNNSRLGHGQTSAWRLFVPTVVPFILGITVVPYGIYLKFQDYFKTYKTAEEIQFSYTIQVCLFFFPMAVMFAMFLYTFGVNPFNSNHSIRS